MARTYASVEIDPSREPLGWKLMHDCTMMIITTLRKGGFYAGFETIEELSDHCIEIHNATRPPPMPPLDLQMETLVKVSLEDVYSCHASTRHRIFTDVPFSSIHRLESIANAGKEALKCIEGGGETAEVEKLFPAELLKEYKHHKDSLASFSADQYLPPSAAKKKEVATKINCYVQDGDTVLMVSSCSSNFFSGLPARIEASGKRCNFRGCTIENSFNSKEWLLKAKEDMATGSKLIMCFSLGFELQGQTLDDLFDHALLFKPKLIVLIAPILLERLQKENSYDLIWEDNELLKKEALWPWGSMDVPVDSAEDACGVSPRILLWSRLDWFKKHKQVASQFAHVPKNSFGDRSQLGTFSGLRS